MTTEELIEKVGELLDTEVDDCIVSRINDETYTLGVEIDGQVWFLEITEG